MKQAIGILGGTFDPVHFGHLRSALDIAYDLNLAKVQLMPNSTPPHKSQAQASDQQRLAMLNLATSKCDKLGVDSRELISGGLSYSVLALEQLRQEYPDTPLCFLMGMDSLLSLTSWHRWQELLTLCHIVVSQRPGWPVPQTGITAKLIEQHRCDDISQLSSQLAGKIVIYQAHPLAISSSQIRTQIKQHKSIEFLLPESVDQYIKQHKLYL